jgi:hypothetical protein
VQDSWNVQLLIEFCFGPRSFSGFIDRDSSGFYGGINSSLARFILLVLYLLFLSDYYGRRWRGVIKVEFHHLWLTNHLSNFVVGLCLCNSLHGVVVWSIAEKDSRDFNDWHSLVFILLSLFYE